MGLTVSHLCRGCGTQEETSAHIMCKCEALASQGHTYFGSFFLDPEEMRSLSLGAIWNFNKEQSFLDLVSDSGAQRARFKA